MSDNRTTELREKLDDLIIELDRLDIALDSPASDMTIGEYEQEREKLLDGFMQAIAATLGSDREKRLEKLARSLYADYYSEWPDRAEEVYADCMEELGIEVD